MTQSGYDLHDLVREAQTRWLKPAEVFFILQTHTVDQLTHEPARRPASGSLFLFNKRVLRFFRKDGHSWRKKKDGRTVGEAHERLKVGNVEALNCYYAHGEENSHFQRRSYWMLDPTFEHIVLVHYRDISEGRHSSGSISLSPETPSTLSHSHSPSSYTAQHPVSTTMISELHEPYQSPGSIEVSSDAVVKINGMDHLDTIEGRKEVFGSSELGVSQALRRLEVQLSLTDDTLEEIAPLCNENENSNDSEVIINDFFRGGDRKQNHQSLAQQTLVEHKDSLSWKEVLEVNTSSPGPEAEDGIFPTSDENGMLLPHSRHDLLGQQGSYHGRNLIGFNLSKCDDSPAPDSNRIPQPSRSSKYASSSESLLTLPASKLMSKEVEIFNFPAYSPVDNARYSDSHYFATLFDQGHNGLHFEADSSLTIAHEQKFTIRQISPEWGYASEATKVIIVGSILCDPSEGAWTCMLGDIEVPVQIIQEGVISFLAPPHLPGKVALCISSGNKESCSEVREFEYRVQPSSCDHCDSLQRDTTKSLDELLLLVRFVQMLLHDPSVQKGDFTGSGIDPWGKVIAGEDTWGRVIEALLVGSWTSSNTTDWLMQELLKDKLRQWLSSRSLGKCDDSGCSLSKKEQGVIHMVAGLGFEWALYPVLNSRVSINFRDINGWTALHWAAHFGREKMVAALIASGASAGAVTDPSSLDPTGQMPASIAASSGHKGLAGYLSEVALTSHLSSLKFEEEEFSNGSADVEIAVNSISESQRSFNTNDNQNSFKDTLAAVRNAAQAAARIQAAFRAHSFRRRQEKDVASAADASVDGYNILSNDIQGLSVASKLGFRNGREYYTSALSIQKKFRGWKGRKDFLAFRKKVVKIQAHVRGHQVRKHCKVICWAVGVLEKVVLRWRRKGVGLRGYRHEIASIDESEDEDIIKVFRKQKVEGAIDEAVSRVLSMVDSPDARQQYSRMLERYQQAKVGNVEALNCYYAHGEENSHFQRRSYWMLDPTFEHIVLVHYRDISEGRHSSGSISLSPETPSTLSHSHSPSSYTAQHPVSTTMISELHEPYQSPGSIEVSSDAVVKINGMDHLDTIEGRKEVFGSSELGVSQALRRLEVQLSLTDDTLEEIAPLCNENENSNDSEVIINDFFRGGDRKQNHQSLAQQTLVEHKDSLSWKEVLEVNTSSPGPEAEDGIFPTSDENGMLLPHSRHDLLGQQGSYHGRNLIGFNLSKCDDSPAPDSNRIPQPSRSSKYASSSESLLTLPASKLMSKEVDIFNFPAYSPVDNARYSDSHYFATLFDQGHNGLHFEADSSLTIAHEQKFTIRQISPEWGYASEATKVIIVGSILCDPSEGAWTCMLGDIEVPVQIIQEGVISFLAPPHLPGKVALCISSGNKESCSEVREFEYRVQPSSCDHCDSLQRDTTKSLDELLLLVRFVQMLLHDPSVQKGDFTGSGIDPWGKVIAGEDTWGRVIEALLVGSWTSSNTTDWLMQELLKDKLRQWLSSRSLGKCDDSGCSLSKKEQGVIHMVAGLGFEWALYPVLNSRVSINFRDINGWTALHWAAHFGREKMVAALIASGASAGAVTDPSSLDPTGQMPASIAASSGHKGLAGYLSEVALTSHLSSLKFEEEEFSNGSADVEIAVNSISESQRSFNTNDNQNSFKDTLAAVRNAAQAAARIQAAFRAHSFRRRQEKDVASAADASVDGYNILSNDIQGLSVASKLGFRNGREYYTSALSIQKKFRGWKGRKDFLAFRKKVVKIQAHVRGHQVRKHCKVICWAVGVLEKVVLRWRRKGVGLRGYRHEIASIDESEDEDIIKVFRKQKVEGAIDEAVSRVLSMVDSPDARQQYSRMLERYQQAKAEFHGAESEVPSISQSDITYMENEDAYQYL